MFTMLTVILLAILVIIIMSQWVIFEKMGLAGWKCLIPFYNTWLIYEKTFGDGAYMFVPFVIAIAQKIVSFVTAPIFLASASMGIVANIVIIILFSAASITFGVITTIRLAHSFGKYGFWYILGMMLFAPIFQLIIAFGDAQYQRLPDYSIDRPFC